MFAKFYGVLAVVIDVLLVCMLGLVKTPLYIIIPIVLLPVIFAALFCFQVLLCYIISLFVNKSKPVERPNKFFKFILDKTVEFVLFFMRYKLIESGKEIVPTDRRFLLVSNHLSAFDPIATIASLQKYGVVFVSKPENFKIPAAGGFMHKAGFLPIDRDNARNAMKTLHKCVDLVKNDIASVCIYPEGHRSETGELQEFKDGVFYVAKKGKCPIVIMTVRYEKRKLWGKKAYLHYKALIEPEAVADKTTHLLSDDVREIMLNK